MKARQDRNRRGGRWLSRRISAGAVLVLGLLVFTWPFVRTPRLPLAVSYLHLLGAWLGIVVLLFAMARSLTRDPGDEGGGEGAGPDA